MDTRQQQNVWFQSHVVRSANKFQKDSSKWFQTQIGPDGWVGLSESYKVNNVIFTGFVHYRHGEADSPNNFFKSNIRDTDESRLSCHSSDSVVEWQVVNLRIGYLQNKQLRGF